MRWMHKPWCGSKVLAYLTKARAEEVGKEMSNIHLFDLLSCQKTQGDKCSRKVELRYYRSINMQSFLLTLFQVCFEGSQIL